MLSFLRRMDAAKMMGATDIAALALVTGKLLGAQKHTVARLDEILHRLETEITTRRNLHEAVYGIEQIKNEVVLLRNQCARMAEDQDRAAERAVAADLQSKPINIVNKGGI